jgi:hypothetical protein
MRKVTVKTLEHESSRNSTRVFAARSDSAMDPYLTERAVPMRRVSVVSIESGTLLNYCGDGVEYIIIQSECCFRSQDF